jgi:hypothetical protein
MGEFISLEAVQIAKELNVDIFQYNGKINPTNACSFIEALCGDQKNEKLYLVLNTSGGDADAAYRMARCIQERYKSFTIFVTGPCKSAGTLIAIGAQEVVFSPYGELGPLDVQNRKQDRLGHSQSGLVVKQGTNTLISQAHEGYFTAIDSILTKTGNGVSFPIAAKAASDLVHAIYSPILAKIDPEAVGENERSMKIAEAYGIRLNIFSGNLKPATENDTGGLRYLLDSYPSHSFVIKQWEAEVLIFQRVRGLLDTEVSLIKSLGESALSLHRGKDDYDIICRSLTKGAYAQEEQNEQHGSPSSGTVSGASQQAIPAEGPHLVEGDNSGGKGTNPSETDGSEGSGITKAAKGKKG